MYRLAHLPEAIDDIFAIEEYLNRHSPDAAERFIETLGERITSLADRPFLWPVYERDPFFRRMMLDDYVLFYSVDEKRNLVVIHRIFHHSRNINQEMLK